MRVLRKEDDKSLFFESNKPTLTMLFNTRQSALHWRQMIEQHMIRTNTSKSHTATASVSASSATATASATSAVTLQEQQDIIKRYSQSQNNLPTLKSLQNSVFRSISSSDSSNPEELRNNPELNMRSLVNTLVIPTSGGKTIMTEALKLQIVQTMKNKV